MADFEARDMLSLIREDISKISVLWEELHEDFLQKLATAVESIQALSAHMETLSCESHDTGCI